VVTSVNRLVAARPYPVVHVEAPDPDIIMRRPATSERTMTPAMASKRPLRFSGESRPIQCRAGNRMRQPRSPVSTTLTSSDGASATALLGVVLRVLDTNSQLKCRLTIGRNKGFLDQAGDRVHEIGRRAFGRSRTEIDCSIHGEFADEDRQSSRHGFLGVG
jgi:hypothetical protein